MAILADSLRGFVAVGLFLTGTSRLSSQTIPQIPETLPDPVTLLRAASDKEDGFARERQKYLCVFKDHNFMTGTVRLYESFYIHGHEIQRLLEINGVPLSSQEKQTEEARVSAEIKADRKKPSLPFVALAGGMSYSTGEHSWAQTVEAAIIRESTFSNERRVDYRGRPAIQIDFRGNSQSMAQTGEQLLASAMSGTIIVDQESAAIVRIGANLDRNVFQGNELLAANTIMFLGYDAVRVAQGLYLPSSWVRNRYIHGEYEDWWLQSCRIYGNQSQGGFKDKWAAFWRRFIRSGAQQ